MNTSELLSNLYEKGVELWEEDNKLKIRSPKGAVTPDLREALSENKEAILSILRDEDTKKIERASGFNPQLSMKTLGYLISRQKSDSISGCRAPVIDCNAMANMLRVTFRPLPKDYRNPSVIRFRNKLFQILRENGVKVEDWDATIKDYYYKIRLPLINRVIKIKTKLVNSDIDAVIDIERYPSLIGKFKSYVAEKIYQIYKRLFARGKDISIPQIAMFISWAEEHAAKHIEDPTNTQVIVLTSLDKQFTSQKIPYQSKIEIGINTLIRTFSEIVIGVSDSMISILNMNLSDSIFPKENIENFVAKSLIPKVFVPINPLLMNQFEVGTYNPLKSVAARKLVSLGHEIASTGLLPSGFKLDRAISRESYRDIVNVIVNGRTGVSYGFVAYIEPPQYIGKPEITESEWEGLSAVTGLNTNEIRENDIGRQYLKTTVRDRILYKQIPDIWLVSSRSGANKTNLAIQSDVLRIGLLGKLHLSLPALVDSEMMDIKPSYDIYVMVSIALGMALYIPDLVREGAPIVHFHGYPSIDWFQSGEYYQGSQNPSVPCGTYESGAFNFLNVQKIASKNPPHTKLLALIEPDHGTNIIARDPKYLVTRLKEGCQRRVVELGGRHFHTLLD